MKLTNSIPAVSNESSMATQPKADDIEGRVPVNALEPAIGPEELRKLPIGFICVISSARGGTGDA